MARKERKQTSGIRVGEAEEMSKENSWRKWEQPTGALKNKDRK